MHFDITLKNEKEKTYRLIILFFVVLHVLFFIYLLFNNLWWKKALAGLIITALYAGYRLLITNTKHQKFSFGSGYFFVLSILIVTEGWWFWAIELILSLISQIALTPFILTFSVKEIKNVGFPFKKYKWNELTNVILKDNILTLDFKNNKLLQAEIEPANISEVAFNTFAQEQLNKT